MNKILKSRLANIYICIISLSIIPLLIYTRNAVTINSLPQLGFWILITTAAELKPIMLPTHNKTSQVTLSFAVHLSSIILLGTGQAVWNAVVSTLIVEIIMQKSWQKTFFNVGQYGLTLFTSGVLFHLLKFSPSTMVLDITADIPAVAVSATIYILLNVLFISAVISLTSDNRFLEIFIGDFRVITFYFYSLAPISVAISLLYQPQRPYIIFIMIPPLIMADQALRRYYRLHHETQQTLQVMADIIDKRDEYTSAHSQRVAEYARKISQQLNLSPDDVKEIETAGLVHDLGKVAVEDHILRKDGKLTQEEYEKIRMHPETGYQLLKNLKPYKKGSEYVLFHHERMDGTGYPHRLSSKAIPLGARILAVADSYDAMTSDRPYRKALPNETALQELIRCSGSQFDPIVVEAFIQVLNTDTHQEV